MKAEEIVKKFDLQKTNHTTGSSFKNGVDVYQFIDDVFMAECNSLGERTVGQWIIYRGVNYIYLSSKFLSEIPRSELEKITKDRRSVSNSTLK